MKHKLCPKCSKEVLIENGELFDYTHPCNKFPKGNKESHECVSPKMNYPENGISELIA